MSGWNLPDDCSQAMLNRAWASLDDPEDYKPELEPEDEGDGSDEAYDRYVEERYAAWSEAEERKGDV